MRRILALVLAMVMTVSLFAGVALAAPIHGQVRLTTSSVVISGADNFGTATISGRVTTAQGAVINRNYDIEIFDGNTKIGSTVTATGGQFSFIIPTNISQPKVYQVKATDLTDASSEIDSANLTLRFGVTLNNSLNYLYSPTSQEIFSGVVRYSGGGAAAGVQVQLWWLNNAGNPNTQVMNGATPVTATTNSTGVFGTIINGWEGQSGKIGVVIGGILHMTGEVKPMNLSISATPSANIVHTITTTNVVVQVSGGTPGGIIRAVLYKGSELIDTSGYVANPSTFSNTGTGQITLSSNFSAAEMGPGTYTIVVEGLVSGRKLYEASTNITVINPARFTLVNDHQLNGFNVGDYLMTFGSQAGEMRIVETTTAGAIVYGESYVYTVYVNGELAKDASSNVNFDKRPSGSILVKTTGLANVAVRVVAHRVVTGTSGTTYSPVFDRTYTVPVSGWQVTYSPNVLTVGKPSTVSFVIRDKDGNFVNNAQVILRHSDLSIAEQKQSPLSSNIQNGTYTFTNLQYGAIGSVRVIVANMDYVSSLDHALQLQNVRADFATGIDVVGEKVYTVSSSVSTLLAGKTEIVTLSVLEGQNRIIPDAVDLFVKGVNQGDLGFTPVDTNSDGLPDSIRVNVTATNTDPIVLRVRNSTGSRMGEVALTVVAPKLVKTSNSYLTDSITSSITFKVVDPRTNTALTDLITIDKGAYIANYEARDTAGRVVFTTLSGGSEYTLTMKVSGVDFVEASKATKVPALAFTIRIGTTTVAVDGVYEVKKPSLTSNPTAFIIGLPTNLTVSYTDANDRPLVGYTITVNGVEIGKTNAQGQVAYVVSVGTSTGLNFKATTDVANYSVELNVTSTFDTEPPKITAPTTVDAATAVITVTDNVRVARLMVNGVEINIFPLQTINHPVSLNLGVNTFRVAALDTNNNVTEQVITITRTSTTPPPATVMTTVIGQRGYIFGGVVYDMEPIVRNANDDTMMPVRFLQAFGAEIDWDPVNQTATFTYGSNVVSVTVGSTTALVNGQNVSLIGASGRLAPAYLAPPGRVMVPTRFVSEKLGFSVTWAPPNNITITAP